MIIKYLTLIILTLWQAKRHCRQLGTLCILSFKLKHTSREKDWINLNSISTWFVRHGTGWQRLSTGG